MTPRLTVVVLAYNEVENLEPAVREIHQELRGLTTPPPPDPRDGHEMLIVDDGSSDGTGALADRLAAELPGIRVIHHGTNLGLGGGYRTGFAEASRELLTFYPADGQFPSSILATFVPLMAEHDLVLGYLPNRQSSLLAKSLSAAERVLYWILFGRMPKFQGVLMVRRALLPGLDLQSQGYGWGIVMEMVLKVYRRGHRVISVPTTLRPRLSGQSKVNSGRSVWNNFKQALALRRTLKT